MKLKKIGVTLMAAVTAAAMLTGCAGNNSDTSADNEAGSKASATEAAVSETGTETGSSDAAEVSYPITIDHAFGQTVIESQPERVVTISWGNQDVPLALGIVPVGVSKANFGLVDENGLLPWTAEAYEELGVDSPVVFDDTDGLDYEAISDAKPDVILAAYSGITQEEYDMLSQIAPVVAYPGNAWQTYWREQTLMDATAIGKAAEAEDLITETEVLISKKTEAYESLQGKTAAFLYFNTSNLGEFYVYLPSDPRAAYLTDLGLSFPESITALAEDSSSFSITLSVENIDVLNDVDMIVTYGDAEVLQTLQADALVGQIPAIANGAVAMVDTTSALAASCTPTVLSIPATIDDYLVLLDEAAKKVP